MENFQKFFLRFSDKNSYFILTNATIPLFNFQRVEQDLRSKTVLSEMNITPSLCFSNEIQ